MVSLLGVDESSKSAAARVVAAAIPVGMLVFLAAARLLRCEELAELWGAIRNRQSA